MTDNAEDPRAFIARHPRLDNLITFLLQSEDGQELQEAVQQRDKDAET